MRSNAFVLIGMLAFSCACGSKDSGKAGDVHGGDENALLQLTYYTDSAEIYVELPALVSGEETVVAVHITRLSTCKPYLKGLLSLELGSMKGSVDQPERPGIFKLHLKPLEAGHQRLNITFTSGSYTAQVSDSIRVYATHEAARQDFAEETDPGVIHYDKEQSWNSDFRVQTVHPKAFSAVILASGEILPVPGEKQNIVARSGGIVLFASRNLVQGSRVTKGELLFTISGQDLAEDNIGVRFAAAHSRFQQSKREYDRHRSLYGSQVIAEKQYQETLSRYRIDSASYFSLAASVTSEGLGIYAPLSGYLHELNVSEGQYVTSGQPLATLSDNRVLLLRADVPQHYYQKLNLIKTAHFRTAYSTRTYRVDELGGRLLARGASVAENNHYMPVYFEVYNDGSLLEGAFAEFYLITEEAGRGFVVPLTAITEEQGNYFVYIQQSATQYAKRAVDLGDHDGLNAFILSGISAGERIVTRGALLLKAASMSSAMPVNTHEH